MGEYDTQIQELKTRVDRLETQVTFLIRRLGIEMQGIPKAEPSPRVQELIRQGKTKEAIRQFVEETGAGLKDAKTIVESYKI